MRALACFHAFAILMSTSAVALAQSQPVAPLPDSTQAATPQVAPSPSPAPLPAPAPAVALAPPTATRAAVSPGSCSLGNHSGLTESDSITVSEVVCSEVRRRSRDAQASYLVEIQRLGNIAILSLVEVDSGGRISDRRSLRLSRIEEVFPAAPRLAESLLAHTPIEGTQRVDNIVGEEARVQKKKYGKTHFGLGVVGTAFPGAHALIAPGIDLALYHETARWAVGGDLRVGSRSQGSHSYYESEEDDRREGTFASLSVGARYFTSLDDITPFFGGGLSWSGISTEMDGFDGDDSGVSAYVETGVEVLRTHKTHLNIGLRANIPTYTIESTRHVVPTSPDGIPDFSAATNESETKYVVPVSLAATVLF